MYILENFNEVQDFECGKWVAWSWTNTFHDFFHSSYLIPFHFGPTIASATGASIEMECNNSIYGNNTIYCRM